MNIYDELTAEDKSLIKEYIRLYGPKEETYHDMVSLGYILRFWAKNKENFYKAFGNNFIIKKRIEYKKSQTTMAKEISNACYYETENSDMYPFAHWFSKYSDEMYRFWMNSRDKIDFDFNYYALSGLLSPENLAANTIQHSDFYIPLNNGNEKYLVRQGSKTMKVLGKIAKNYGVEDIFEKFRIAHSMILNQKKLVGNLCLSIHPLDYMTMSDNDCGWQSCMNWTSSSGGEYRQGTVEMMNSPYVIVAYLESETPFEFGYDSYSQKKELWSNKKWRELFIVHDNIISEIKAYPYANSELTTLALDWLRDIFNSPANEFCEEISIVKDKYSCVINPENQNRIWIEMETYGAMYNDFGRNGEEGHKCYLSKNCDTNFDVNYSGESECMWCGEIIDADSMSEEDYNTSVCCYNCVASHYEYCCEECGYRSNYEDDFYWVNDECFCQDCFDKYCATDFMTDEYGLKENMFTVHLAYNNKVIKSGTIFANQYCLMISENKKDDYYSRWAKQTWSNTFYLDYIRYDKDENIYFMNLDDIIFDSKTTYNDCYDNFGLYVSSNSEGKYTYTDSINLFINKINEYGISVKDIYEPEDEDIDGFEIVNV